MEAIRELPPVGSMNQAQAAAGDVLVATTPAGPSGLMIGIRRFGSFAWWVLSGFGLLDSTSDRLQSRAVGEIVTRSVVPGIGMLTGFENHQGRTTLGPGASPLGVVVNGTGNGDHGLEGAVAGGIFATYLHGPVLARNPALADALLTRIVGPLAPIVSDDVARLRRERLDAALGPRTWPRRRRRAT